MKKQRLKTKPFNKNRDQRRAAKHIKLKERRKLDPLKAYYKESFDGAN